MKGLSILAVLLLAGCAHQSLTPPRAAQPQPSAAAPLEASGATEPAAPAPPVDAAVPAAPASAKSPPADSSAGSGAGRPKAAAPAPRRAAAPSAPAPAVPTSPKAEGTLDLAALEQRLRDTRAIGVFTKLSLKNQVDDLLDTVRGYHNGQHGTTLDEAKQQYDQLLVKVLTLLQSGDPALASSIRGSREAIWNLLADRDQFQKMHL